MAKTKQTEENESLNNQVGIVVVRPVDRQSSLLISSEARGGESVRTSVLPNSLSKYMPVLDSVGNFPGMSREEFKKIKEQLDLPQDMTYDKFFGESSYVQIALSHKPIKLNKARLQDYIKYLVLYHHPWVARDEKSVQAGQYYVLIDENKEAEQYLSSAERIMEAMSLIKSMEPQERRNFLFWSYRVQKAIDGSDSVVSKELIERVQNDPKYFIEQFNKPHKEHRILLANATQFKVVTKVNATYLFGELALGTGEDEAAAFLSFPENQAHVVAIQKEVMNARKQFGMG